MFEDENGKLNGYCYSCGTYVADPLGEGKTIDDIPREKRTGLTKEEIAERMEFISTLGAQDLKVRRLRKDVLDYYGIKVGVSEEDGVTPNFVHFPYKVDGKLQSYKTRTLQVKAMWSVGNQKDVDLFGWEQAVKSTAKRLIIVEGEFDAPALKAIIDRYQDEKYKDLAPAVVSLPHGAGAAAKDIGRLADKIRKRFKEVVFCFDDDEAGRKATEECCKVMPTAMSVTLPEKDANECILKGCQKAAFREVMFNAQRPKNTSLVFGRDLHEDAKKPAEWGLSTPWDWLTDKTRGFRFGETWYLGAGEKMG